MTDTSLVLVANAGDDSISVFRFSNGSLDRVFVAEDLKGTGTFAVDAQRDLVYAGVKGSPAAVVTLELDRETGSLTPRSRFDLPDGSVSYLALTRDGSALLGASYGGDYGFVAPVVDGVIGEPTARVEHANLHSVLATRDGGSVYFVSLGDDLVAHYTLADDLTLTLAETIACPAGSGPRHLALSAADDAVYVMTEYTGEVLHFVRDTSTGALTLRGAASAIDLSAGMVRGAIGADPTEHGAVWGADLHWGADERMLWASERTQSTLAPLPVGEGGAVTAAERFTVTERQPRGFAVSPDGSYLIAAGEKSTTVSLYAVDGAELTLLQQAETGAGANWVRFV